MEDPTADGQSLPPTLPMKGRVRLKFKICVGVFEDDDNTQMQTTQGICSNQPPPGPPTGAPGKQTMSLEESVNQVSDTAVDTLTRDEILERYDCYARQFGKNKAPARDKEPTVCSAQPERSHGAQGGAGGWYEIG